MRVLVLDNIRSVYNVGSIFRTADGAGVDMIYLVGITPTPVDRFGRERKDFAKTALGAEKSVSWQSISDLQAIDVLRQLKLEKYVIVAVEQTSKSEMFNPTEFANKDVVYIFGSETEGVKKDLLQVADKIVELPMRGVKNSLNVANTVAAVLYSELLCK